MYVFDLISEAPFETIFKIYFIMMTPLIKNSFMLHNNQTLKKKICSKLQPYVTFHNIPTPNKKDNSVSNYQTKVKVNALSPSPG